MTLDEAINHCEEVAEKQEITAKSNLIEIDKIKADGILRLYDADAYESCMKCASEHRQLAEWLRELKESRIVLDILGQFLADTGTDVCCEDLTMIDDYCEKYCDNQKPLCWYRWAKMKAGEVNADDGEE